MILATGHLILVMTADVGRDDGRKARRPFHWLRH